MSVQIETSTFEKRICIKKDTRRGVLFHAEKKERQAAETEEKLTVFLSSAITFYSFTFLVNDSTI